MSIKKLTFFVCLLSNIIPAFGQQEANTHDGFFVNLSLGANFGKVNIEVDDNNVLDSYNVDFTGSGVAFDLLIGGSPVENIAIHATLAGVSLINPDFERQEPIGSPNGDTEDTFLNTSFLGAGATFYTKDNFFFSPNIGRGTISFNIDSETTTSDGGFGFLLRAGKEWWVGDQWGLGFALSYRGALGSTELELDLEEKWSSTNFSVSFSATFN
ncbi:MAG: hypothetical protein OXH57_05230 [Ekhidna sp.]|nr:hypothetical protein [Ekhidna sp.]